MKRNYLIYIGSLIIWCNLYCYVMLWIVFRNQYFDLGLKSPTATTKIRSFWRKRSKFDSKCPENFAKSSWRWLGDLYREKNFRVCHPFLTEDYIFLQKLNIKNFHKAKILYNGYKHYMFMIKGWSYLISLYSGISQLSSSDAVFESRYVLDKQIR